MERYWRILIHLNGFLATLHWMDKLDTSKLWDWSRNLICPEPLVIEKSHGKPHYSHIYIYRYIYNIYTCIYVLTFFPKSVWAKGSSNSGGLLYILSSAHFLIFSICTYHLRIFTSSHLLSLPLSLLSLSLSLSLSVSLSPSPPLSHSLSLSLSLSLPLSLFLSLSFSLSLSLSLFLSLSRSLSFFFSLLRPRAVPTRRHEMATFSHEMRFDRQKRIGFCDFVWSGGNPFARNEVQSSKADGFLRLWLVQRQPFRTKWGSTVKNW